MKPPVWLQQVGDDVLISIHAQPGASRSEIVGQHGDSLKIRIAAPPVDGRANAALIDFISALLGVPRAHVCIAGGSSSRHKRLRVEGAGWEAVARVIATR